MAIPSNMSPTTHSKHCNIHMRYEVKKISWHQMHLDFHIFSIQKQVEKHSTSKYYEKTYHQPIYIPFPFPLNA